MLPPVIEQLVPMSRTFVLRLADLRPRGLRPVSADREAIRCTLDTASVSVSRSRLGDQAGLTLVEVVVAAALLLVGVLGAAQLVTAASGHTVDARGRAGAVGLARRVVEVARSVPPAELSRGSLAATLQRAAPDLAGTVTAGDRWTVTEEGYTYAVAVDACDIDDPGDGTGAVGSHHGGFCAVPAPTTPADRQPADYRRMSVEVTWSPGGRHGLVRQVVELSAGTGRAPTIASLGMTGPATCAETCPAITAGSSATFAATTTGVPASVTWLVNGAPTASCPPGDGGCAGSGTSWSFAWALGTPTTDGDLSSLNYGKCIAGPYVYDGVHEVGVRGADAAGLAGPYASVSVSLNRCAALAPVGVNATGRDRATALVDVEWSESVEGDVIGYRVYRGESLTAMTPLCPASIGSGEVIATGSAPVCVDESPPGYAEDVPYWYAVVAVDRDAGGALREGALAAVDVNTGNQAPSPPDGLAVSHTAAGVQLSWTLPASLDPDAGDTVDSFRIYRRDGSAQGSPSHGDRYDREAVRALCTESSCTYLDTGAEGVTHTYWITAVDTHLRESATTGAVTG